MNLPAICNELRLRSDGTVPVVNSRDVAERFGKQHQHVLRDIEKISPNLDRSWFRSVTSLDTYGREQPSYDLTRQGFTLLVMGWTGEKAMAFKVRYIEAFDAMERELKSRDAVTSDQLLQSVRELVSTIAVRHDGHDNAIAAVKQDVCDVKQDVAWIKSQLHNRRRKISDETRAEHIDAVSLLGGSCPCCRLATVIEDGKKTKFSEFDHHYQNSYPDADHTWLICKPCHNDFTYGRVPRDQRQAEFQSYQNQRRRLPGRQIALF